MEDIKIYLGNIEGGSLTYLAMTDDGEEAGHMRIGLEAMQFTIEDFFVRPRYRRLGIGSRLLDEFLRIIDYDIMMPCNMTFTIAETGVSLLNFWRARSDFMVIDAGITYRARISEIVKNESVAAAIRKGIPDSVRPLGELDKREMKLLYNELSGKVQCMASSAGELKAFYDSNFSSVCIKEDKIAAAFLVWRNVDEIIADVIYSGEDKEPVLETISRSLDNINSADPDTWLSMFAVKEAHEKIFDRLLDKAGDVQKMQVYVASWLMYNTFAIEDVLS